MTSPPASPSEILGAVFCVKVADPYEAGAELNKIIATSYTT